MKIVKSAFPANTLAHKYLPASYTDVYKCTIEGKVNITPDDIQVSLWTVSPPWIQTLFNIRNSLVKLFGLKGDKGNVQELEESIRSGGSYSIFTVMGKTDNETVLKLHDDHLDAYLSVHISENDDETKDVNFITIVHVSNLLGSLYFRSITPFHKIVVKGMLKFTLNRLINSASI